MNAEEYLPTIQFTSLILTSPRSVEFCSRIIKFCVPAKDQRRAAIPTSSQSSIKEVISHTLRVQNGLLISLVVLFSVVVILLLVYFLFRKQRMRRSLRACFSVTRCDRENVEEQGATLQVQGEGIHDPISTISPTETTSVPALMSDQLPSELRIVHPFGINTLQNTNSSTPASKSARSRRKPPPLDLGYLKELPLIPIQESTKEFSAPQDVLLSPERREWNGKNFLDRATSSGRLEIHPKEESSIMRVMAAHSRLFKPGTSSSPPMSPKQASRRRSQSTSGVTEGEKGERWDFKRETVSTIPAQTESGSRSSGPIRYRSVFQLPISATPPDLPTTPLVELPPCLKVEAAGSTSTEMDRSPLAAVTESSISTAPSATMRTQLLGSPSPALFNSLTAKRNSFGIEEEKQ